LAVLKRADDGAVGRLDGPASFMVLRAQATPRRAAPRDTSADIVHSTTDLHPYDVAGDRAAAVAIGQRTQGITSVWHSPDDSADGVLWLRGGPSWATIDATHSPPYPVEQAGPRRLVDEVAVAYRWWQEQGEPGVDAWRVTVRVDGRQTIELSGE
jgi:hypothetical protein